MDDVTRWSWRGEQVLVTKLVHNQERTDMQGMYRFLGKQARVEYDQPVNGYLFCECAGQKVAFLFEEVTLVPSQDLTLPQWLQ